MAATTSPQTGAPYPAKYETEVVLRDGSTALLRPIRHDDTERWLDFIHRLSTRTKYLRFHHVPKEMTMDDALRFCTVDYTNAFAFVAEMLRGDQRDIIGIGRYIRLPDKRTAEVAFVIEDAYHGRGIGTKLVEWLVNVARDHGITTFEADVLAENREMMRVFSGYGFHITSELAQGVYRVTFPIAPTRGVLRKEEKREATATLASLRAVLKPRSVAVVGASKNPGGLGRLIFQSIVQSGFSGVAYPVNPNADAVSSVKAYPSVADIPGDVDLAVIVVPAPLVAKVADECGRKGVHAIVVISDGFKERGPDGAAREQELRAVTFGRGMRLVGPNCMGVINTDPAASLNATFWRGHPKRGGIAFLTQSGAMGLVVLEYATNLNVGISTFVSLGNRSDISPTDLLHYCEQDPATRVILLYVETFGDPRKFSRVARRVSAAKPIVAVKGGSTAAGSRAAMSHTGALATPDIVSDALFRQAGIIRVDSVEQLFDVAALLSTQPVPRGRRLAIVTNGGGPGIIAADASAHRGLTLPDFSVETTDTLKTSVKRDISFGNPLDLTAGATAEEFESVLNSLAADPDLDAVLTIFVPPIVVDTGAMEDTIRRVSPVFRRHRKPLLACFIGQQGVQAKLATGDRYVPCYLFPEDAVTAFAKAVEYGELSTGRRGTVPRIPGIRRERARKLVQSVLTGSAERPLWLSADAVSQLLACYGIRAAETVVAGTAPEAAALAAKIGFPVAVKLNSSTIIHKTDVGGVMLDVKSADEVKKAFESIRAKLKEIGRDNEMQGVTIQRMVKGGVEAIVGVTQDPSFGPLIMFGIGGIYAELLNDVAVRFHPLTDADARELIGSVRMARLLEGFRGAPPSDTPALEDLLLRLSALVEDIPQISELDFNPVKVMPLGEGYWVVDSRIAVR
jgi:acetyl coenzyme A synthetase (ADP forming)-like protein